MSVHPVQPGSTGVDLPTPESRVRTATPVAIANEGTNAAVETAPAKSSPVPVLFPEHEVRVLDDSSTNGILVYRTLDKKSGDIVTQVPSATVLNEVRETQELARRFASRGRSTTPVSGQAAAPVAEATPSTNKVEKTNGNKL